VTEILIILALILAHGFFSGAEIAVISMRKTRLRELIDEGSHRARAVMDLRNHPERFLATMQVGVTVLSEGAAAFGGASVAKDLVPVIRRVPWLANSAEAIALTIVIAGVAFLSLVLGELVPKSLALRSAEGYALLVSKPLVWMSWAARPLAWVLTGASNLVLRPFGDRTNFIESRVSADELQQLVDEATRSGELDTHSGEIASRALEFGDLTAGAVMVPRNRMAAVPRGATDADLRKIILESGRTRLPVYEDSLDNIVGYLRTRDVLENIIAGKPLDIEALLRPAHFVPRAMRAVDVLKELQRRQTQLALVVDEHGGVSGLITLEDIVEELVGDIVGEHETREEHIHREAEELALVQGQTPIRELNRELDLDLPENDQWTTVGGLCTALAGGIPSKGERLVDPGSGIVFEVVSATPRSVGQVRLVLPPRDEESDAEG
jgi:putative hemolysin